MKPLKKLLVLALSCLIASPASAAAVGVEDGTEPQSLPNNLPAIRWIVVPAIRWIVVERNAQKAAGIPPAVDCSKFVMTQRSAARHLKASRRIAKWDYNHTIDWLPCFSEGKAGFSDGRSAYWAIGEGGGSYLGFDDGTEVHLYCANCRLPRRTRGGTNTSRSEEFRACSQSGGPKWLTLAMRTGSCLPQLNGNAFPLPVRIAALGGAVLQLQVHSAIRLATKHDLGNDLGVINRFGGDGVRGVLRLANTLGNLGGRDLDDPDLVLESGHRAVDVVRPTIDLQFPDRRVGIAKSKALPSGMPSPYDGTDGDGEKKRSESHALEDPAQDSQRHASVHSAVYQSRFAMPSSSMCLDSPSGGFSFSALGIGIDV